MTVLRGTHLASPSPEAEASRDPRWPRVHHFARSVERLVHVLDSAVTIPGTSLRIGLDPVLGFLLPGAGDALGGVVSLSVLFLALQYRVPAWVIARMVLNIAIDAAVGGIPFLGDAFDVVWKANEKNFLLVQKHRRLGLPARMPKRYWAAVVGLVVLASICLAAPVVLVVWLVGKWLG
jgi:hypothetical protein